MLVGKAGLFISYFDLLTIGFFQYGCAHLHIATYSKIRLQPKKKKKSIADTRLLIVKRVLTSLEGLLIFAY